MNAQLDAQLVKDHPILFADRHADMHSTAMCWGFECGDGWYELLKEAADKLEPLCRTEFEEAKKLEKPWYRHVRSAVARTSRLPIPRLFETLFWLVNKMQPNIYNNPIAYFGGPPCRATQVKEKYGTLRFYMSRQTTEMDPIIAKAERKSAKTCEVCGKPGKLRGSGWLYTACARHVKES